MTRRFFGDEAALIYQYSTNLPPSTSVFCSNSNQYTKYTQKFTEIYPHRGEKDSKESTIVVDVCSELTEYRAVVSYLRRSGQLRLIHDAESRPVMFTIDEDKQLCVLEHGVQACEGWSNLAITPTGASASSFDVIQSGTMVFLTVVCPSISSSGPFHDVYHCTVDLSKEGFSFTNPLEIDDDKPAGKPLYNASTLQQTEPIILGGVESATREDGMISLFKDFSTAERGRCVGQVSAPGGGYSRSFEFKAVKLGNLRGVFSLLNPWNLTDVFIARQYGIGFYGFENIDNLATEPILPEVGFRQLVASEDVDPHAPDEQSKIAIFAVSDDNCLYFVEGTRRFADRKVSFSASGFPIRTGVTHLSARYNASHGTSELLYGTQDENALYFIRRDPEGRFWSEDRITWRASKFIKYDAFVTAMLFTDGNGQPLPLGYPISLTADSVNVVTNGASYSLTPSPTVIYTDASGSILMAIPSQDRLGVMPVTVSLGPEKASYQFTVNPDERVRRLLGKFGSTDTLLNATTTTGEKVFDGYQTQDLEQAAAVLGNFQEMKESVEKLPQTSTPIAENPGKSKDEPSWLEKVGHSIERFFCDVVEFVKKVVKSAVKVYIRVVGPVLKLVIDFFGKVLSFEVKTVYALLEGIGAALDVVSPKFGLKKFLRLLKLSLDPECIKETQQYFNDSFLGSLGYVDRFLTVNRESMICLLDDVAALVQRFIDDPRDLPKENQEQKPSLSSGIMNNPFIRLLLTINPISWIMEAIEEEIPDIQVPSLTPLLQEMQQVVGRSMNREGQIIRQLLDTLIEQFEKARNGNQTVLAAFMTSLQGTFWTLYDTLRTMVEGLYDWILVFIRGIGSILTQVWKIPGLTDLWEDITGTEFTLLGFATYLPIVVTNFHRLMVFDQLPVEMLPIIDFETLPVHRLYHSHQIQPNFFALNAATVVPEQLEYLAPTLHHTFANKVEPQNIRINSVNSKSLGVSNSVRVLSEGESFTTTKTGNGIHWLGVVFENVGRILNGTLAGFESLHGYGQIARGEAETVGTGQVAPATQTGTRFRHINTGQNAGGGNGNGSSQRNPRSATKCIAAVGKVFQVSGLIISGVTGETAPTSEDPFRIIPAGLGILDLFCVVTANISEGTYKGANSAAEVLGALGSISRAWILDKDQEGEVETANKWFHTFGPAFGLVGMGLDCSKDPRAKLVAIGLHFGDAVCGVVGFATAIVATKHAKV
ncbi:uncharacterized protein N7483_007611 [Penicillium malachiteum]|uniref:uncharacterized protein n=1 Tax=Penicillium malachiteum TaxID=1324776 RepID=UPI002549AC09|nr:uncharacterized protein N7483_007611 [Penicillium malachiteum]KAJ5726254.1 hypothetical protein N7483_007611 [Penicillium malachiteum]